MSDSILPEDQVPPSAKPKLTLKGIQKHLDAVRSQVAGSLASVATVNARLDHAINATQAVKERIRKILARGSENEADE